ncbi:hypothetical protein Zmor_004932 [Zophobas morio]|uniref:Uncharacterized protein n=1 Tax=Zophobas morio TaxID=2755281 RepID=A0AA38MJZ8_9CUCU|nr:hypothetical protein Zmor_004932 [Zophobas morio]
MGQFTQRLSKNRVCCFEPRHNVTSRHAHRLSTNRDALTPRIDAVTIGAHAHLPIFCEVGVKDVGTARAPQNGSSVSTSPPGGGGGGHFSAGGGRTCARENNHLTPAFTWTDANFSSVREHDRRVRWEVKVCACGDEEVDRTRLFEWRIEEESNNGYQHGDTTNRDVSVIMLGPNPSTSTVEHFTYRVNIIAMPLATRLLHGYHCPVITA